MAERKHEATDIHTGRALRIAMALVAVILLASAAAWFFPPRFSAEQEGVSSSSFTEQKSAESLPRAQISPSRDLAEVMAKQRRILHGYGWIDRNTGVVRIPIQRAMEQLIAKEIGAQNPPEK